MDELTTPAGSPYPGELAAASEGGALPPVPPPSLDSLETSAVDNYNRWLNEKGTELVYDTEIRLDEDSRSARFRHSGWAVNRRRVFESLKRTGQSHGRLRSFADCGSFSSLEQHNDDPTKFRIRCNHCKDRFCVPCGNARAVRVLEGLGMQCRDKRLVFITLTLRAINEPLSECIDRLYRCFKLLRQTEPWIHKVRGGAAMLEVKRSDKMKRWHPHLHILADADYMDQGFLSKQWHALTKDSFIVDIQRVAGSEHLQRYVTKYVTKPLSPTFVACAADLDEAILAMRGRRLCMCFGDWYGTPLNGIEDDELDFNDHRDYHLVGPLEQILLNADAGSRDAINMLKAAGIEGLWRQSLASGP